MSEFSTANIISRAVSTPSFPQGLNVGGADITTLVSMTEYYEQAGEPTSPANGAVWWTGSIMYQYVGGAWRIVSVSVPTPPFAGDRGLFAGGIFVNVIDYVTISTPGNATDFGDLTSAKYGLVGLAGEGRGVFGGAADYDTIDYVTIATAGNAADFGNLTSNAYYLGACSSGIRGLFGGGQRSTSLDTIDYITIATTGNATSFIDLTTKTVENGNMANSNGHGGLA